MAAPAIDRCTQVTRNQGQPIPNFIPVPRWVDVVALSAGSAKSYTVPAGGVILRLTPSAIPCYGNVNGTAVVPTTDKSDGTGSFPVGGQTYMVFRAGDTLSLICASAITVVIEVWS